MTTDVIRATYGIIGAGISGLLAANQLQAAGHSVVVIDKARGVGGRMATRRRDGAVWDHGAQYARFHQPEAFAELGQWQQSVLQPWFDRLYSPKGFVGDVATRWKGDKGMTSLPKFLAEGLNVHLSTRIITLKKQTDGWQLIAENGETFQVEKLLITSPMPQTIALLKTTEELTSELRQILEAIEYNPCLALLLTLEEPSQLPAPGAMSLREESVLAWIADNQQKGISPVPAITLHAQGDWSAANFDADEADITATMLEAARPYIGPGEVTASQLMRWRYSQPKERNTGAKSESENELFCLVNQSPALLLAGDGFGGSRVEGAMLSGRAAAAWFLKA